MKILHVLYELKFSGAEIMYVDAADEFRSLGCELYVINSAERLGKYADMFKDAGYKVYHLPCPSGLITRWSYCQQIVRLVKKEGIDDSVLGDAIKAHNPKCGMKAKTNLQYALLAADPMSGFVKAVAQIYPDKKIASVKHKSVMKRFNELRFASGANRDYMEAIEFTGLSLDDLIDVAL